MIEGSTFVLLAGEDRATFAGDQDDLVDAVRDFVAELEPARRASQTLASRGAVHRHRGLDRAPGPGRRPGVARADRRARRSVPARDRTVRWSPREEHGRRRARDVRGTGAGRARGAGDRETRSDELGLEIRAGVHVGEIETVGDDVTGVTVNVAARVAAIAGASEILVSSTVKDLTPGSGLDFEDAGEHELKGVPDRGASTGSWADMDVPETRYAKTVDGVHIAYQVLGDGPRDLVYAQGMVSSIKYGSEMPVLASFLKEARVVLQADHLRPTRGGGVGQVHGTGDPSARGRARGHHRRARRSGLRTHRVLRTGRWRAACRVVRRVVPRADGRLDPLLAGGPRAPGPRLSVGLDDGGMGRIHSVRSKRGGERHP